MFLLITKVCPNSIHNDDHILKEICTYVIVAAINRTKMEDYIACIGQDDLTQQIKKPITFQKTNRILACFENIVSLL